MQIFWKQKHDFLKHILHVKWCFLSEFWKEIIKRNITVDRIDRMSVTCWHANWVMLGHRRKAHVIQAVNFFFSFYITCNGLYTLNVISASPWPEKSQNSISVTFWTNIFSIIANWYIFCSCMIKMPGIFLISFLFSKCNK